MPSNGYLTTDELIARFDQLVIDHSALITKLTLPYTSSGGPNLTTEPQKTMYYYKIGLGGAGAPKLLINAGIHAREWAPPDSVLTFFELLIEAYEAGAYMETPGFIIENPDKDKKNDKKLGLPYTGPLTFQPWKVSADEVKHFIEDLEIYVVPTSNPDGRDFTLDDQQVDFSQIGWRTNRRPLSPTCAEGPVEAIGVDLNRNFDIAFDMDKYLDPISYADLISNNPGRSTTDDPCDSEAWRDGVNGQRIGSNGLSYDTRDVYQGPSPASENETKNLQDLMNNLGITYYVDIHQAARSILIPWGMNSTQVYDNPDPSLTYLNPNLDTSGGSGGRIYNDETDPAYTTLYREYFPDFDGFELQVKHWFLAAQMQDTVFKAADGDLHVKNRSKYAAVATATGLYPAFGGSSDYALGCCMHADGSGHAEIIPGKFPIFSLTLEAGHKSDGEFWPSVSRKQYDKVEREIHCCLRALLAYASNTQRLGTTKTPK